MRKWQGVVCFSKSNACSILGQCCVHCPSFDAVLGDGVGPDSQCEYVPANTRHRTNVGLMSVQRLRRWNDIKPALVQCIVFAGELLSAVGHSLPLIAALISSPGPGTAMLHFPTFVWQNFWPTPCRYFGLASISLLCLSKRI